MRITTGIAKGRQVPLPKGAEVRPTADRVKQSLFNILGARVQGAKVLDLFCGSGNLGLEALSRGARSCNFSDQDGRCVQSAQSLAGLFGLDHPENRYQTRHAKMALSALQREEARFDLVFLDPPYKTDIGAWVISQGALDRILEPEAWVVLEHESRTPPPEAPGLNIIRVCRYGSTALAFYGLNPPATEDLHAL
jgi:16S rRNA (guanine966-N2)-methyltransferase